MGQKQELNCVRVIGKHITQSNACFTATDRRGVEVGGWGGEDLFSMGETKNI